MPSPIRGKHLARYRTIAGILLDEGLGYWVGEFGLTRFLRASDRLRRREPRLPEMPLEQRVRHTLDRLGPAFVKAGQLLSTRPDLLPESYIAELRKLQDAVAAVPFDQIRDVVERELGSRLEDVFETFESEPLAAASIGQVHGARLWSGEDVVVKVQRPGIEATMETDLDILRTQALFAENQTAWGRRFSVSANADEIGRILHDELDYLAEGRNAEKFAADFADDDSVAFPEVHWEFTTKRVITLERFRGVKLTSAAGLVEAGFDPKVVAHAGTVAYMKMIFMHGFFHGDPHPGNLFVLSDGRVAFTDFGRCGTITPRTREQLADLLIAVLNRDERDAVDSLLDIGVTGEHLNVTSLESELARLFARYYDVALGEIHIADVVDQLLTIVHEHELHMPSEFILPLTVLAVLDGIGLELDPEFNFVDVAKPFASQLIRERVSPDNWLRSVMRTLRHGNRLLLDLPESMSRLLKRVSGGSISVEIQPVGFDKIMAQAQEMVNRLAFSLLVGSFVIGFSMILRTETLPHWFIVLTGIALLAAAFVGAWLFLSVFWAMFKAWRER
jgi:ubiquinone biosynthesis protein